MRMIPILMTGEMVLATLERRKRKTRRIIKIKNLHGDNFDISAATKCTEIFNAYTQEGIKADSASDNAIAAFKAHTTMNNELTEALVTLLRQLSDIV